MPASQFDGAAFEPPPDSQPGEAELEGLLSDLFTSPPSMPDPSPLSLASKSTPKDPMAVITALQKRFEIHKIPTSEQSGSSEHLSLPEDALETGQEPNYLDVLQRLEAAVIAAEETQPSTSTKLTSGAAIPLGLATQQEWESLFHTTVRVPSRMFFLRDSRYFLSLALPSSKQVIVIPPVELSIS